jgi:hypothetical protein
MGALGTRVWQLKVQSSKLKREAGPMLFGLPAPRAPEIKRWQGEKQNDELFRAVKL